MDGKTGLHPLQTTLLPAPVELPCATGESGALCDRQLAVLDVPVYNFHDQGARALPRPVRVKPGDSYRVTCTHDATLRRQLPELRPLPPRYVVWGDGSSDEMCLGIVIWSE